MRLGSSLKRRRSATSTGTGRVGIPRWIPWSVGTVLGGFAFGWLVATRLIFPAPPPPGDLYQVPDVSQTTLDEATTSIAEAGLVLGDVTSLRHPELDSGRVVGQAPLPGQLASPNSQVRLTLSLGPERRPVPEVMRLRADRARSVLEAAGFVVVADSIESSEPLGSILDVEPAAGTDVGLPSEVRLTISLGPPMVAMPLLLGMREAEALDTLAALGLVVDSIGEVFRFGRDQGLIVEQAPPAASLVEKGSPVRLSVGGRGGARRRGRGRGVTDTTGT